MNDFYFWLGVDCKQHRAADLAINGWLFQVVANLRLRMSWPRNNVDKWINKIVGILTKCKKTPIHWEYSLVSSTAIPPSSRGVFAVHCIVHAPPANCQKHVKAAQLIFICRTHLDNCRYLNISFFASANTYRSRMSTRLASSASNCTSNISQRSMSSSLKWYSCSGSTSAELFE